MYVLLCFHHPAVVSYSRACSCVACFLAVRYMYSETPLNQTRSFPG